MQIPFGNDKQKANADSSAALRNDKRCGMTNGANDKRCGMTNGAMTNAAELQTVRMTNGAE
jgi:hypothetical protein